MSFAPLTWYQAVSILNYESTQKAIGKKYHRRLRRTAQIFYNIK